MATNFTAGDDAAFDVQLQATGEIVVAEAASGSNGTFAVARYLAA